MKTINYLSEDPVISSQKYTLLTIVGPNMPQKCDVWGIKVRGSYGDIEEARSAASRLAKIDPDFDIHIADVGKFVPIVVSDTDIPDKHYQDERLNELMQGYYKNQKEADDFWLARKNKLHKQAIENGLTGENKEHPIAVLQREEALMTRIRDLEKRLVETRKELEKYTPEELEEARTIEIPSELVGEDIV